MADIIQTGSDTAIELVIDVLNASWNQANTKATDYQTKINGAMTGFLDPATIADVTAGTISAPSVTDPNVTIPQSATTADVVADFVDAYPDVITELTANFASFQTTYFPNDTTDFSTLTTKLLTMLNTSVVDVTSGTVTAPSVSEPTIDIPPTQTAGDVIAVFETQYAALMATLETEFNAYRTDWFENEPTTFASVLTPLTTLNGVTIADASAGTVATPTVIEPTVYVPQSVDSDALWQEFTAIYTELVALLASKHDLFLDTYYPDEQAAYNAVEDWLQAAISNAGVALPAAVAGQIWTDDRDRIVADGDRASADVLAQFAARGFPLPPGAAASAMIQISNKTQDAVAESSRKVAITSVDMQKFTVDNLMKLRHTALGSANDYIKSIGSAPDIASRMVNIGYDAQSKLISSVASLLNARSDVAKIALSANTVNAQLTTDVSKANQGRDAEKLKLGISTTVQLRDISMRAATEYSRVLATGPEVASRVVGIGYDAQSKLISSVASLLGARSDVAKLSLSASTTNAQLAFEAAKANQIAKLEQLKMALTLSMERRKMAMQDSLDYIKSMAIGPETVSRIVGIGQDAQAKLISSAAQYYSARVNAAELSLKASQQNASMALEASVKNQAADLAMVSEKLRALLAEAQSLGQMATSLYNNLHAQAQVSGQRGTHVQYQYGNDTQTAPPSTTDVF